MLNPPVNGKIQGLFKAFVCYSSTFKGKLNFQGLFKTVLYIEVLFKPVQTLYYIGAATCDFQQCGILASVDSDEPVQPPLKLRNYKCRSVSSLTVIEYSSNKALIRL